MKCLRKVHYSSVPSVTALLVLLALVGAVPEASAITILDIQSSVDASGGSTYQYQVVTVSGTVTATTIDGYVVAEAPGPWQAISIQDNGHAVAIGDEVLVTGLVYENYGMTVLVNVMGFEHLSAGNAVEATVVGVGEASQEQYESVLISVEDVTVAALLDYGEWAVVDAAYDLLICDDQLDYVYFPQVGDQLDSLTGFLAYTYGAFKLEPRATSDISGEPIPHYALHGHVVTMNDTRDVLRNAYVEILGDEIVAIQRRRPTGIPVIRTRGMIFPGLVDSHNHPSYNGLGPIPFEETFTERYEWQAHPLYDAFNLQLYNIAQYGGPEAVQLNAIKLAEVRALTAGTTSIQGSNCNDNWDAMYAHQGIVINNVERYPALAYHSVFPLSEDPGFWDARSTENWDRFLIHLAEGTSAAALDEFYQWKDDLGMLDARTTIIHGVPLGDPEWAAMAAVDANLVWSPMSNLRLYGQTADIPGALAAGVNVALAPDWTVSGTPHMMAELKMARFVNWWQWGGAITPLQFAELVTRNAAKAVGSEELVGQIAPGFRANLMVIHGSPRWPYRSLMWAKPSTVRLTVVDGRPMYGNPVLMARFDFLENVESIEVGGREKGLAVQVDAHGIPESDKPFAELLADLEEAYEAAEPKVCGFLGIE